MLNTKVHFIDGQWDSSAILKNINNVRFKSWAYKNELVHVLLLIEKKRLLRINISMLDVAVSILDKNISKLKTKMIKSFVLNEKHVAALFTLKLSNNVLDNKDSVIIEICVSCPFHRNAFETFNEDKNNLDRNLKYYDEKYKMIDIKTKKKIPILKVIDIKTKTTNMGNSVFLEMVCTNVFRENLKVAINKLFVFSDESLLKIRGSKKYKDFFKLRQCSIPENLILSPLDKHALVCVLEVTDSEILQEEWSLGYDICVEYTVENYVQSVFTRFDNTFHFVPKKYSDVVVHCESMPKSVTLLSSQKLNFSVTNKSQQTMDLFLFVVSKKIEKKLISENENKYTELLISNRSDENCKKIYEEHNENTKIKINQQNNKKSLFYKNLYLESNEKNGDLNLGILLVEDVCRYVGELGVNESKSIEATYKGIKKGVCEIGTILAYDDASTKWHMLMENLFTQVI